MTAAVAYTALIVVLALMACAPAIRAWMDQNPPPPPPPGTYPPIPGTTLPDTPTGDPS